MTALTQNTFSHWPRLLFVLGKGGVGRSTIAASLAQHFVEQGERVLIVQWALTDVIGHWFDNANVGHNETQISKNLFAMNFDSRHAIREYFVDHLKMGLVHKMIIENRHVQKLVQAAPGLHELFFSGRLFWLEHLALEERGWQYDRIIVDSPATGHSFSLFQLAKTLASYGFTGPLAYECERVSKMLDDKNRVGAVVVTIPEELPVEETTQFLPKLTQELGRPPLKLFVNRTSQKHLPLKASESFEESPFFQKDASLNPILKSIYGDILKRQEFEHILARDLAALCSEGSLAIDDFLLDENPDFTPRAIVDGVAKQLQQVVMP